MVNLLVDSSDIWEARSGREMGGRQMLNMRGTGGDGNILCCDYITGNNLVVTL